MEHSAGDNRYRSSSLLSDGLTPRDKHDRCWWILILIGTGLLLPWNAVLTAFDYFSDTYGSWTNLSVPLLNQAANLIFMLLMVKYGNKFSFTRRIVGTLIIYVVCLIAIPVLSLLAIDYKVVALVVTFCIFVVLGATCAVLQGSLFGLCGSLPPEYTNAIMAGSAVSGVLMNGLMMVTKGLLEHFYKGHSDESTNRIEAFVFFGFSALFTTTCIFGYLYIVRKPFIQHHVAHLFSVLEPGEGDENVSAEAAAQAAGALLAQELKNEETDQSAHDSKGFKPQRSQSQDAGAGGWMHLSPEEKRKKIPRSESQDQIMSAQFMSADGDRIATNFLNPQESPNDWSFRKLMEPARQRGRATSRSNTITTPPGRCSTNQDCQRQDGPKEEASIGDYLVGCDKELGITDSQDLTGVEPTVTEVLPKIKSYGAAVMLVFTLTLYVFPGFLTVLCAKGFWGHGKNADDWMRLVLLSAFNVTDLAGRIAAPALGRLFFETNRLSKIWICSLLRLGFIPIAWLVVLGDIDTVYIPLVMTLLLGLSNGCLGSLCMMYAPANVEPHEQELAGTIMALCLMLGITLGALFQDGMTPVFNAKDFGKCHD